MIKYLVVILYFSLATFGITQSVQIAAASDLQFALTEISEAFKAQYPEVTVTVSYGSSGNLYSQLEQGAPFDLYFSASADYTRRLEESEKIVPGTRRLYAVGRLVIWGHDRLGLEVNQLRAQALVAPEVERVAIANPDHAPYGLAAVDFLKGAGLYEQVRAKLVYGENISQAAQLALNGGGIGIIALSLAMNPTLQAAGSYYLIPLEEHLRLEQEMVIVKDHDRPEVQTFYDFVQGETARAILEQYGFLLP